jgi:hypothetical protein
MDIGGHQQVSLGHVIRFHVIRFHVIRFPGTLAPTLLLCSCCSCCCSCCAPVIAAVV